MFVLVATNAVTANSFDPIDGHAAVDGELVVPRLLHADCEGLCTCDRAWQGVMSNGVTPTAIVARRPGIDRAQMREAIGSMLERNGLIEADEPRSRDAEIERYVDEHLRAVSRILCEHGVGTVLARKDDEVTPLDVTEAA